MRSTPCPKLIFRTVKLACGPLSRLITTPSNACTRSLSPSLIFTWTRTVSPGRNAGMSVRRDFASSFSIIRFDMSLPFACSILISNLILSSSRTKSCHPEPCAFCGSKDLCIAGLRDERLSSPGSELGRTLDPFQCLSILFSEFHALHQIRPVPQRLLQCLLTPPPPNFQMVAVNQNLRHRHPTKLRWTRVVRIVQQSAGATGRIRHVSFTATHMLRERFLPGRRLIPDSSRQQARDSFDNHRRSQLTAAQHVVADGKLAVGEKLRDALIDPFIPSADQDDSIQRRQFRRNLLREPLPLCRKHNYTFLHRARQPLLARGKLHPFQTF